MYPWLFFFCFSVVKEILSDEFAYHGDGPISFSTTNYMHTPKMSNTWALFCYSEHNHII